MRPDGEHPARRLLDLMPSILWTVDRDLHFTLGMGSGLAALGIEPRALVGMSLFEFFRTDSADSKPIAAHLRALEGETLDYDDAWKGRVYRTHVEPLRNPEGDIIGCLGVALDVTEHRRMAEEQVRLLAEAQAARSAAEQALARSRFLSDIGRELSSSLDYEDTLHKIVRLAVPTLADICMLALLDTDGALRPLALAAAHPELEEIAHRLAAMNPWRAGSPAVMEQVMAQRRARIVPEVTDAQLVNAARDPAHLAGLRSLGMKSIMLVPLETHGKTLGVLTLVSSSSERRYGEADLPLAQEVANRCAMAVENARLYREVHEALARRDESLAQLDTLLKTAPIGLAFLDIHLRFVRVNDALRRMQNPNVDTYLGGHVREVLEPELAEQVEPLLLRAVRGEPIVNVEVSGERPAGSGIRRHWLASYYPVRTDSGQVLGVGSIVVDVTERKRAEDERQRLYREAQDAIRVRDDFLSIASHELKTPLTPLSLRLQGLEKALERGEPVDAEVVRRARRHLDKLTALINDLLDVSRIQSGRLVLHPEPLSLGPLLEELVAAYRPMSAAHELLLMRPEEEAVVRADRARLEQVLQNLVDNAIKYSPNGGKVQVALEVKAGEAVVSVSDQGIGIPREQQKWLFQRYFRARNITRSYGGLGLGLYICRDIVERHGGRIEVESEEGQGATFRVALPLWRG